MADHIDQEKFKREIYDKLNPRRRKFIDRIGYDAWDPFQKPNDPLDMRTDSGNRTIRQLVDAFLREAAQKGPYSHAYGIGALECALGLVNRDEKYAGVMDFCLWYHNLSEKGHAE
ncbi:MAG: hypothetical protein LBB60_08580 [Desulfovibrio sp.]|jgi:hypothetical protein|nr:hypothetical protein [Desulfovibrio sp.]